MFYLELLVYVSYVKICGLECTSNSKITCWLQYHSSNANLFKVEWNCSDTFIIEFSYWTLLWSNVDILPIGKLLIVRISLDKE